MKIQDCFKVEPDVIDKAKEQAKKERTSKSSIYRKAIVEYLERQQTQITERVAYPQRSQ